MQSIKPNQTSKIIQKQSLSLSNKMLESIRIMELPILELRAVIFEELEKNVALELVKDPSEKRSLTTASKHKSSLISSDDFLENVRNENSSVQSCLLSQLSSVVEEKNILELSSIIIQNLDDKGFNIVPIEELISSELELNGKLSKDEIRKAIELVHFLDPKGCAFDGTKDFMLFQLNFSYKTEKLSQNQKDVYTLAMHIVDKCFSLLDCEKKIKEELKKNNVCKKISEINQAINLIKELSPYPTYLSNVGNDNSKQIVPDVFIEHGNDGVIVIKNRYVLPIIRLSKEIKDIEKQGGEASNFAHKKLEDAKTFISILEDRDATLCKVVESLTLFQRDFFYYGISYLAPLRQKDIANELKLSPSTISRIANSKYLSCKWGIFPISYFFTQKATKHKASNEINPNASYTSTGYSRQACKEMIKSISNSHKNISDKEIAEILLKKGINISRRTVTKYRKELGIKNSFKRKE